jgi:hypothetical protein
MREKYLTPKTLWWDCSNVHQIALRSSLIISADEAFAIIIRGASNTTYSAV